MKMSQESKAFDDQVAELSERFESVVSKYKPDPTAAALAAALVSVRATARADAGKADFLEMCEAAWKLAAE